MSDGSGNVRVEIENGIGTLTIDRPESRNALNTEVIEELIEKLEMLGERDLACLILTGSGDKAFIAGADIQEMVNKSVSEAAEYARLGHNLGMKLEKMPIPTIAAVNGVALGGGTELALACNLCIAAEDAVFGQPEINLGITPGWGGTQRLPRVIGPVKAMEMILTGEKIEVDEAEKMGMVNEVVPKEELLDRAKVLAEKIARRSKISIRLAMELVNTSMETSLENGLELERKTWPSLFDTHDQKEGMEAFLEKRKPKFRDK